MPNTKNTVSPKLDRIFFGGILIYIQIILKRDDVK